jgi:hypothetical protein
MPEYGSQPWYTESPAQLLAILKRPVRMCNMEHEDVVRKEDGLPIVPSQFRSECPIQHLGCYHLLMRMLKGSAFVETLLEHDAASLNELLSHECQLEHADELFRHTRTGVRTTYLSSAKIPRVEETIERSASLARHHQEMMQDIERIRVKILPIFEKKYSD